METENIAIVLAPLAFFVIFPLFWSGIVFFISRLGGWNRMADAYTYHEPLSAECLSMQSATLRFGTNYRAALKICADAEGIYFSTLFVYRPGHAPFFVPWGEINGTKTSFGLFSVVDLRFQRTPDMPFRIYPRVADKLVEVANGRWGYGE